MIQASEMTKLHWRSDSIPVSCDSCRRFSTFTEAESHARKTSKEKREARHVINTGDYFFSSTTAIIFFYETLMVTYYNGQVRAAGQQTDFELQNDDEL